MTLTTPNRSIFDISYRIIDKPDRKFFRRAGRRRRVNLELQLRKLVDQITRRYDLWSLYRLTCGRDSRIHNEDGRTGCGGRLVQHNILYACNKQ